ncbi:MAG: hypothetical protein JW808_08790, partial [Victivallales bacterium]|nr:hypothetical protein [Victivallales bacterium]
MCSLMQRHVLVFCVGAFGVLAGLGYGCLSAKRDSGELAGVEIPQVVTIPGPFRGQSFAFYFVHSGGPLTLNFRVSASDGCPDGRRQANSEDMTGTDEDPKILLRFFDCSERLVNWRYQRLAPGSVTVWDYDFGKDADAGIYQIRYAGQRVEGVDAWAEPARPFGLAPLRCHIHHCNPGQFSSAWFKVPPGTGEFKIGARGF